MLAQKRTPGGSNSERMSKPRSSGPRRSTGSAISVASFDDEAAELEHFEESGAASVASTGASASTTTTKAKAKGKAMGMYTKCNVCESTDMAAGMKQCKQHNRTVRNIFASLEGDDEGTQTFTEMRDTAPDHPPSQFASTVKEHEEKFPAPGRGKKRTNTKSHTASIIQTHRKTSRVKSVTRFIKQNARGTVDSPPC